MIDRTYLAALEEKFKDQEHIIRALKCENKALIQAAELTARELVTLVSQLELATLCSSLEEKKHH